MKNNLIETKKEQEKVLIVVVDIRKKGTKWHSDAILSEMNELVLACGADVIDSLICKVSKESASTLIGPGHVENIVARSSLGDINTVVFSHDLKGSHQRNLEDQIKLKTIDRTQLILDIFAKHAKSNEGKMQVELAQLQYLLPRLHGKGVELSRLGGGVGTLGPGETKLEVDRRRISQRVTRLKKNLEDVSKSRLITRKKRQEKCLPNITLVGYTNAGKTTLLNQLTDEKQKTQDGMFTTLDSLSRQLTLPNKQKVVISDTVGFINDLPHHLIESFKATLEVVSEADLLLHVLDVSHPNFKHLEESVGSVLIELKATDKPTIMVLNKIDKLEDKIWIDNLVENYDNAVCISASKLDNIDDLLNKMINMLSDIYVEVDVNVPLKRMDLVSLAHEEGQVIAIKYYSDKINIRAMVPNYLVGRFYKR